MINARGHAYSISTGEMISVEVFVYKNAHRPLAEQSAYRVFFYPNGSHMAQQRVFIKGRFVMRKLTSKQSLPADIYAAAYEAARQIALEA